MTLLNVGTNMIVFIRSYLQNLIFHYYKYAIWIHTHKECRYSETVKGLSVCRSEAYRFKMN
jgi:hypothetical protein